MATPVINSAGDATAIMSSAFTYSITGTNTPTSFDATPLPSWLSVDTGTGDITGTPPNTLSPVTITISATNASGTGTALLRLRVEITNVPSIEDLKVAWFAAAGFVSNDLNSQMSQYLAANGGGISNDLNTQWYTFLAGKGRTGSFIDRYRAELIASCANTNSKMSTTDLERIFFGDTGNTFA